MTLISIYFEWTNKVKKEKSTKGKKVIGKKRITKTKN